MIRRTRRLLGHGLLVAAVAVWVVGLRPQALGGPALYIVVRGSSMVPTYESGDLVVVQSASAYAAGDVIAYRVPEADIGAGHIIIHRIAGGDGAAGFLVKGDNNPAVDPWTPRTSDVAGKAWLVVPGFGRVVAFIHQPVIAGALAAAMMVTLILARPSRSMPPRAHAAQTFGSRPFRPRRPGTRRAT